MSFKRECGQAAKRRTMFDSPSCDRAVSPWPRGYHRRAFIPAGERTSVPGTVCPLPWPGPFEIFAWKQSSRAYKKMRKDINSTTNRELSDDATRTGQSWYLAAQASDTQLP